MHFDSSVRDVLVQRLDALNHDLALATAELFGELAALNQQLVLERLVLTDLRRAVPTLLAEAGPLAVVAPEQGDADAPTTDADAPATDADAPATDPTPALDETDALKPPQLPSLVTVACSTAQDDLLRLLRDAEYVTLDATYTSYLLDAQHQVIASMLTYETWGDAWWQAHVPEGAATDPARPTPACPFLDALLRKLQASLSQAGSMNLAVTGTLTRLSQCGNPLVHAYLFPRSVLQQQDAPARWQSLASTLATLWEHARRRAAKVPEFEAAVAAARKRLVDDLGGQQASPPRGRLPRAQDRMMFTFSKERRMFIEAFVLLEEFVKEVSAVLDAKRVVVGRIGADAQAQASQRRPPEPEDELDKAPAPEAGAGGMPPDDDTAMLFAMNPLTDAVDGGSLEAFVAGITAPGVAVGVGVAVGDGGEGEVEAGAGAGAAAGAGADAPPAADAVADDS